ncbi:DEAD/DEAH box helicase [Chryseobacterium sp. ERMR1:04]|uniref:DEAD/DEAH box helicase n=1 Tax=Chryseobacterium sp. ERMR1:04 TaxID=1705393 RepID=UPI0006C8A961|nr:DEAD/DEAH box helicase [Chryseobacterium sp. ERMR1:04]
MAETKISNIAKFILNNANSSSINRSMQIYPVLKSINNNNFVFEYKGSAKKPYIIEIYCDDIITVDCSCPYDYDGICKHGVASLEKLALIFKEEKKDNTKPRQKAQFVSSADVLKKEDNSLSFTLENGIIDDEKIRKELQSNGGGNSYHQVFIIDAVSNSIVVQANNWEREKQTFTYYKKNSTLKVSCTCKKKFQKKYCQHLYPAFEKIMQIFGNDYFNENYLENKKSNFLADYGLDLQDDYQKYFDFKLNDQGFFATSKFPNLHRIDTPYESDFSKILNQPNYRIPDSEKQSAYGEALVFEFDRNGFVGFVPVTGKFNKERTELATHFKEISYYSLDSSINNYDEKFIQVILKSYKLSKILYRLDRADDFSKAIHSFSELISLLKDYSLFAHQERNTYTRKNLDALFIVEKELEMVFQFSEDPLFYQLEPKIKIGDQTYKTDSSKLQITPLFIKKDNEIYPIKSPAFSADLQYYIHHPQTNYIKKNAITFKEKILSPLSQKYQIKTDNFKNIKSKTDENGLEKQVYIEDADEMVSFTLAVQYPEKLIDIESKELRFSINEKGGFSYLERNIALENQLREEFLQLHPDFQDQEGIFHLNASQLMEDFWFLEASEKLRNQNIKLLGAKELKSFKYNLNKASISVSVKSDIDWFDISIDVSFGDQKLSLKDLQKAFVKKSNFVVLGDGSIGIMPKDWMDKFAGYFKVGEIKKEGLQISNFQFGIIDELYNELEEKPDFLIDLYEKKKRIQSIENIEKVPVPKGIKAKLREYQIHGLHWLNFLDTHQLGGCLADDMGLGKTLQMITFLQHLKTTRKPKNPSLIIAPTSLIFNWQNEINKFCPTLKLLVFTGLNRAELLTEFTKYDIIITTYGSIINDAEFLKDIDFNYLILDESQAIKNPNSKRYKCVRLLKAYNRVVLTGTPIENNTFDLYAQFNFVNPGLLGNMTHFKKEFSDAIDKEKDVQSSELLSKIISPFILRRTKEQVATELPDKVESIIYCEMEKEQRKVYDTFKDQYRDFLLNKIDENGIGKSQMYILEGLTKLRQICNSPAILSDKEEYTQESVKLDILIENIIEKTGNHKILVFSSFVKMLQLVKNRLEENNITYEYLDGQTKDRQNRVENFQNQEDIRVFLISLKAGGTGLNLTEADYVFIIDPWWNPAVENQAIDRCYRIGQKKQVMAYRMICKDTIEEKIINLQQKKKKIASSIISVDEESKSFNAQEVKDLFG